MASWQPQESSTFSEGKIMEVWGQITEAGARPSIFFFFFFRYLRARFSSVMCNHVVFREPFGRSLDV